jgi:hypothetical protein
MFGIYARLTLSSFRAEKHEGKALDTFSVLLRRADAEHTEDVHAHLPRSEAESPEVDAKIDKVAEDGRHTHDSRYPFRYPYSYLFEFTEEVVSDIQRRKDLL